MTDPSPSKWLLDRYATGELSPDDAAAVEDRLDDAARAHLDAVAAARAEIPPVDVDALRSRARAQPDALPLDAYRPTALADPAVARVVPANAWRWLGGIGVLVAAALAWLMITPAPPQEPTFGIRGGSDLVLHVASDGVLERYVAGTTVGEGDVLGFEVSEEGRSGVVVLSVDGTGAVTVFFPESGDEPVPLDGAGRTPLDGTVVLDGAPGPEVFVAVFDTPVYDAVSEVTAVFEQDGHPGLLDWADRHDAAAAAEVTRR